MTPLPSTPSERQTVREALAPAALRLLPRRRRVPRGIPGLILRFFRVLVLAHAFWIGSVALLCGLYSFMDPGVTAFQAVRALQGIGKEKPPAIMPLSFVPYKKIPKSVRNAFVQLEDHGFWTHYGISPGAMREAMERNAKMGRLVYGGSTISQQTAKNLFLYPDRSFLRKYLEIQATLAMELILPKERILELYLNTIEFGPGAFGLDNGSRYHYGVPFRKIGTEQAWKLAAIITDPLHWTPQNFRKNPGMRARYNALFR